MVIERGIAVDQLYIVSRGSLEMVIFGEDGYEETTAQIEPYGIFDEVLGNIPKTYNVRVCDFCKLLTLDKQCFVNITQMYFKDGMQILTNLLEGKDTDLRSKLLESEFGLLFGKEEVELALRVNNQENSSCFKDSRREIYEPKICTVFLFHPRTPIERRDGLVMWVPWTIEGLL